MLEDHGKLPEEVGELTIPQLIMLTKNAKGTVRMSLADYKMLKAMNKGQ